MLFVSDEFLKRSIVYIVDTFLRAEFLSYLVVLFLSKLRKLCFRNGDNLSFS